MRVLFLCRVITNVNLKLCIITTRPRLIGELCSIGVARFGKVLVTRAVQKRMLTNFNVIAVFRTFAHRFRVYSTFILVQTYNCE